MVAGGFSVPSALSFITSFTIITAGLSMYALAGQPQPQEDQQIEPSKESPSNRHIEMGNKAEKRQEMDLLLETGNT